MELRVASQKVRGLVAAVADSVSSAMRTACRLPLLRAIVTPAARRGRIPGDAIAGLEGLPGPIHLQPFAQLLDAPDRLMTEDDRECDRQFPFPQMHVGPANARHLRAHQFRSWSR